MIKVSVKIAVEVLVDSMVSDEDDINYMELEQMVLPLCEKIEGIKHDGMEIDHVYSTGDFEIVDDDFSGAYEKAMAKIRTIKKEG